MGRALWCVAVVWFVFGMFGHALADGVPYSITLEWDANTEPDIAGYIIRYGTARGVYTNTIVVGNTTSLIIPDLATDTTIIYFVISAYNTAGMEGPQSLETNTNPADTALVGIAMNYGKVIPDVANGIDAYIAFVPFSTMSVVVTPMAQDGAATVTVNGANVPAGSASGSIMIDADTTTVITLVITAKNGVTTRTVTLNITRLTALESWRLLYFGSAANAGPGADFATPQNDGIPNLLKFATRTNPTRPEESFHTQGTLDLGNNSVLFNYRRNVAAREDGMIFTVEWSDTMEPGSWSAVDVNEMVVPNGDSEFVTAIVQAEGIHRRFVRLVIAYP